MAGEDKRLMAELAAGAALGHIRKNTGSFMNDQYTCTCGWESPQYWDGFPYAHGEWVAHIKEEGAEIQYRQEEDAKADNDSNPPH